MSISLRIILFIVSFVVAIYVLRRIRKAKLKIEYSLFWIVFSFLLLVLSIFPQIALADLCGIQSPVNFIFLFMIFILLLHNFYITFRVSHLENMIQSLTQEIAVRDVMNKEQ